MPSIASSWQETGNLAPVVESFEDRMRRGGDQALRAAGEFFVGNDNVHRSLRRIAAELDRRGIPYAVAGGMALGAHGYARMTVDVDVILPADALARVHAELVGVGYRPAFPGSRGLRDVETGVKIDFLLAGEFPGDDQPKPVAFPDPAQASVSVDAIRYLSLERLIELKLVSGMTNAARLKDLGDVQELIRTLRLERDFAERLHPYVRPKYAELWTAVAEDRS